MNLTSARRLVVFTVSVVVNGLAIPSVARAGLFAQFRYDHGFDVMQPGFGGDDPLNTGVEFSGTTLPVQRTQSLTFPHISGSASYAFADDGTTVTYQIACQGQATLPQSLVGEGNGRYVDTFTLTQPATYVATVIDTGYSGTDLSLFPYSPYAFELLGSGTMTHAGTLPAGVELSILENWIVQNTSSTSPPSVSGTESLSIVFTAVPEPASAAVAAAGSALLVGRRRRRG